MRILFSALLFLVTIPLSAATVTEIKFEGLVHMSDVVARDMLAIKPGDEVTESALSAATKKFFGQGYFNDIWVTEAEGVLTFHFSEKPVISRIDTQGWKEGEEDDLDTLLQIKKGSLYDEQRIEKSKKHIIDTLRGEGKIDSVVEVEVEHLENGSVALTYKVREGETIIIDTLDFSGMTVFQPSDFDDKIINKEEEFMGWFFGRNDGKMQLGQLEYDPLRIRDYYMQNGYLDAKVEKPFVRVDFDNYTSRMSYAISEGEIYTVNEIHIYQTEEVAEEAELQKLVKLQQGKPFNIQTFREDMDRIKNAVADRGYAFVNVRPDYRKDPETKTVDVAYKINPGEQVRIRDVIISGNTRTLDRVIRRELYLGPGDLYNLTDLKDSRNALGRTGYFESTTIEEKRIDTHSMDLIVKVKEAPTGNIQVGGGYGSYGGVLFNVSVSDMNIWGSGVNVGVNLERSEMTSNYSFNVSNHRLNDSDFSGNFSLYNSDIEYQDYTVSSQGLRTGIGYRFTRHLSGYLGYGYAANQYSDINTSGLLYNSRVFYEDYSKSSVTGSLTYDSTDDYYLPREGIAASQSLEYAGIGGDADFIKSRTTFNYYYGLQSLLEMDVIFRYKARLFYLLKTAYAPYAERFFMGSLGSVRGYESYSISPSYIDENGNRRRVGGEKTFSNNLELSFPLMPSAKMRLTAFMDWGWIEGNTPDHITVYNMPQVGENEALTRSSYGAAIEWFSPVGPVQLIFATPLDAKPGDETTHFEFTIGQRF